MFSFNGAYRSKPEQSLGGAHKKEARDELVRRAADDREKRNHFKRNTRSATKIQACYRSHKIRSNKKSEERQLFDKLQLSIHNNTSQANLVCIQTLSRKINFFFNPSIEQDATRLIFLSQLFIKHKNEIISLILTNYRRKDDGEEEDGVENNLLNSILAKSFFHFIKKILKYNCRLISNLHKQPAIPVRFIEVFTAQETYISLQPHNNPHTNHPNNNTPQLHNNNTTNHPNNLNKPPSNPGLYTDAIDCSKHNLFKKNKDFQAITTKHPTNPTNNGKNTHTTPTNNGKNTHTTPTNNGKNTHTTTPNNGKNNHTTTPNNEETHSTDENIPHKKCKGRLTQKTNFILQSLKKYLIQNGYFSTMVSLTNQKIPSTLVQSDDLSRIPMATSIRDMILRFTLESDEDVPTNDHHYNHELMSHLTDELLCLPLSSQKTEFLLPLLSTPSFPYHLLLHHLHQHFKLYINTNQTLCKPSSNNSNIESNLATTNTSPDLNLLGNSTDAKLPTDNITNNNNKTQNLNSPNINYSAISPTTGFPDHTTPPTGFTNHTTPTTGFTDHTTPTTGFTDHTTPTTGFTNHTTSTTYPSNLFLLHSLIQMGSPHFEHIKDHQLSHFLIITSCLVDSLEYCWQNEGDEDEENEDEGDDDDDALMDWTTDAHNNSQMPQLKLRCIEFLSNSSSLASSLMTSLSNGRLDENSLVALCRICYAMLHYRKNKMAAFKTKLFNGIAFNPYFLRTTWNIISTILTNNSLNEPSLLLQCICRGVGLKEQDLHIFIPLLSVFATTYNHFLLTVSDAEFHGTTETSGAKAFDDLETVAKIALSFKDCCLGIIELSHPEYKFSVRKYAPHQATPSSSSSANDESSQLVRRHRMLKQTFKDAVKLVKKLYERDCRESFCPPNCWLTSTHIIHSDKLVQSLSDSAIEYIGSPFGTLSILNSQDHQQDAPQLSNSEVRKLIVLSELPFIIPFVNRVEIFRDLVRRERLVEPMDSILSTNAIMIRRNFLYEDAFEKLSYENEPNLKKRLKIRLVNAAGLDEAGVDGGGLFREFMGELIKAGFDSNRGFFKTTSDKLHYPNPQSKILYPQDFLQHFYFLGRILGKVIYEEMLIEVPFASFFLCKLLSRADLDIHHLASLDPLMHRNLLFTKDFNGDVNDLQLNFTAAYDNLGVVATDELKPGGENIPVTNHNRFEYVHLMADFRLNKQIKQHCQAFRRGLSEVVPMEWLHLFDHKELQVLLSGADTPIDVHDLRRNTAYSGGYHDSHRVIQMFWKVVEDLSNLQRQMLLKFVTSCSRPPLLGFKELYPVFCIQMGGQDLDRLPTSSTCMNLLKLPEFHDIDVLANKLLYAIESGSGFELS